jgi:hypothetical protein
LDGESDSDDLSGLDSPLPENLFSLCPVQYNQLSNHQSNNKNKSIPGLDLTKAKKIQELNMKKIQYPGAAVPGSIDPALIEKIKR